MNEQERRTARIVIPDGYASAKEFADDCGVELIDPPPSPRLVTAKTFPVDSDEGTFRSEPAEFAHQAATRFGLSRDQTREIIQAFVVKRDELEAKYQAWKAAGCPHTRSEYEAAGLPYPE